MYWFISLSNLLLINLTDLTNEKQNGLVETNDPKETGYLADADTSSSGASAPQSSDSEDDISNKTKTTATAPATTKATATATTETRKGMIVSPKLPQLCCFYEVTWFKKSGSLLGQSFRRLSVLFLYEVWVRPSSVWLYLIHKFISEENQLRYS